MYAIVRCRVRTGRIWKCCSIHQYPEGLKTIRWASSAATTRGEWQDKEIMKQLPDRWGSVHQDIIPHVQRCNSDPEDWTHKRDLGDSGFHMQFLGTGGGLSDRMSSCTMMRVGSDGCLFDVGEGASKQVRKAKCKMNKINRIFITHMHGDHVLGLPSLLLSSNVSNFFNEDSTLHVYGPPGIYNFITTTLALTCSKIRMNIEVHELIGSKVRVSWRNRGIHGNLPQFRNSNVRRNAIKCREDGTWILKEFDEVTRNTNTRKAAGNIRISAAELQHVPNVQTMGYVIEELRPPLKIDPERARALGIEPSGKYDELKNGFTVMNDAGTREVQPEEVLFDQGYKARKVAYLGDLCAVPAPMERLCRNADVLVHEATLSESDHWKSVRRGHATASMGGRLADSANVDLLVLNHHSATVDFGDAQSPAREAERVIKKSATRVLSAYDFMEISIPREGFRFAADNKEEDSETTTTQTLSTLHDNFEESFSDAKRKNHEESIFSGGLLPKEDESIVGGLVHKGRS